jgi:hypothetical protein
MPARPEVWQLVATRAGIHDFKSGGLHLRRAIWLDSTGLWNRQPDGGHRMMGMCNASDCTKEQPPRHLPVIWQWHILPRGEISSAEIPHDADLQG